MILSFHAGQQMESSQFAPIQFVFENAARYGDIFAFRVGHQRAYFVKHPDYIREVLVSNQSAFVKEDFLKRGTVFLGKGLLTSDGDFHRQQRRLMQPAFRGERIAGYARAMIEHGRHSAERFRDGAEISMFQEMLRLTLGIAAKTLFNADIERDARDVGEAFSTILNMFDLSTFPLTETAEEIALFGSAEFRSALDKLNEVLYRIIREHRERGEDSGDLLSMLMTATDPEGGTETMTDRQLRDEMMTFLLAGHETTANALCWTWFALSQNPEAERKFHEESRRVLTDGRLPTVDDVANLPYAQNVLSEAMRIYPPVWGLSRKAVRDCQIGKHRIPEGSLIFMSQYITQRDERFFPEPEKFLPERWTPEMKEKLPPFAYFPFGGGARRCIGEHFAWLEGVLLLATIGRKWKFRLAGSEAIDPLFLLTLRPKGGLMMTAHLRDPAAGTPGDPRAETAKRRRPAAD